MKNLLNLSVIAVLTLLLSGCADFNKLEKVTVNNQYTVELPGFLSETNDLNDEASLQYQNLFKEFYIIILDEVKEDVHGAIIENDLLDFYSLDIDGYSDLLIDGVISEMNEDAESERKEVHINNRKANLMYLSGNIEDLDIYYEFGFIEGKDHYYQIMVWTLEKNRTKYQEGMDKIVKSFREL